MLITGLGLLIYWKSQQKIPIGSYVIDDGKIIL